MSISSSDYENIYRVTFNEYTNYSNNTVSNGLGLDEVEYISIPKQGLLVRESELSEYIKYGKGFASLECVGCLCREELK